jgi:hypothetical protein
MYRLAKLAAGAKFSNSVVSYGQRPNNYESIKVDATQSHPMSGDQRDEL